jgi:hypothetical protein
VLVSQSLRMIARTWRSDQRRSTGVRRFATRDQAGVSQTG